VERYYEAWTHIKYIDVIAFKELFDDGQVDLLAGKLATVVSSVWIVESG
jgi:hypothetical protein